MKVSKLLLLIFVLFFQTIWAQKAPVHFRTRIANFGKIKEQTKQVSYDFIFSNQGEDPIRIEKVVASCGCTATEYSNLAITHDSTGKVRVTYNTINRPGEFAKTVSVYFKGFEDPETLTIKGIVIGTQRLYERELVFPMGNLRFASRVISLKTIRTKEPEKREVEFFNAGKKDITIKNIVLDTSFMKVTFDKTTLKPKEAAKAHIIYNGQARKDWGLVVDTLWLITNDDSIPTKPVPLAAHIEEYFGVLAPQVLEKAPKIKFKKTEYAFGSVKEGSAVSYNFEFTNEGQQDLLIRKIVPGCSCLSFETSKYFFKPGETSIIKVTLNTSYREGIQNKNITVITNSPTSPSITLWLRGNIAN